MAAYFGDPGQQATGGGFSLENILGAVKQLRNDNFEDYVRRKNFDADLETRQARTRTLFDPANMSSQGTTQPQNVVFKQDMTPYEKAQLGLEGRKLDIAKGEADTRARLGEERINTIQTKNELEKAKSDQIHQTKMDDMQRKIDQASQQMELARQKLQQHADDAQALRDLHDATLKFNQAKSEAILAQRDKEHEDNMRILQGKLDTANESLRQRSLPTRKTTTLKTPEGTSERTDVTSRDDMVHVTSPDGRSGTMNRSEYNDYWKKQGWKVNEQPTINNPDADQEEPRENQ